MISTKPLTAKMLLICLLSFVLTPSVKILAQHSKEVVLGSRMEKAKGNSNVNVVEGEGIGVKMAAGRKPLKLKRLSVHLLENHPDSVSFYIRLFSLENGKPEQNLFPDTVFVQPIINDELNVDLADLNVDVTGDILVGLEWAATATGSKRVLNIPTKMFKKGIYYKEKNEPNWKKVPFFGFAMQLYGERM